MLFLVILCIWVLWNLALRFWKIISFKGVVTWTSHAGMEITIFMSVWKSCLSYMYHFRPAWVLRSYSNRFKTIVSCRHEISFPPIDRHEISDRHGILRDFRPVWVSLHVTQSMQLYRTRNETHAGMKCCFHFPILMPAWDVHVTTS